MSKLLTADTLKILPKRKNSGQWRASLAFSKNSSRLWTDFVYRSAMPIYCRLDLHSPPEVSRRLGVLTMLLSNFFVGLPVRRAKASSSPQETYDKASGRYDQLDAGAAAELLGFTQMRRSLLEAAAGNILEVAVGTGINLPLYDLKQVATYTGLDVSSGMLLQHPVSWQAEAKLQELDLKRSGILLQGDVERMPFESAIFDTVVVTFSLCVFQHPEKALQEMARVIKPGGTVLLLDHSRSSNMLLAAYQDLTAAAVAVASKGCVWNLNLPVLFHQAGLQVKSLKTALAGTITSAELQTPI